MVVHDMLVTHGHLASGEWLLITGVSSGVGVAALQVAKLMGAKVIGTSGSAEKLARLEQLGLDVGVRTRGTGFHEPAMQATGGKGVNLVVNNVGGTVFAECMRCLAYEGRLATVGYLDQNADGRDRSRGIAREAPASLRRQQQATLAGRSARRPYAPSRRTSCPTSPTAV